MKDKILKLPTATLEEIEEARQTTQSLCPDNSEVLEIDTIAFDIPEGRYEITKPILFRPAIETLDGRIDWDDIKYPRNIYYKQNKDVYLPMVYAWLNTTVSPRTKVLRVQCSFAKLMHGDNLISTSEDTIPAFRKRMQKILAIMGVNTTDYAINEAILTRLHPAHNMLTDYPVSMMTEDLACSIVPRSMDLQERTFRNGGDILYYHNEIRELVFYDKGKDIERLENRPKSAICEDKYPENYDKYKEYLKDKNVPRMEYRLNDKEDIKNHIIKVSKKSERKKYEDGVKVKHLNGKLLQAILLYRLKKVKENIFALPAYRRSIDEYIWDIKRNNPDLSNTEIDNRLPAVQMLAEKGYKKTLAFLRSYLGDESKAQRKIDEAKALKVKGHRPDYIEEIENSLKTYKPLTLEDLAAETNTPKIKRIKADMFDFLTVEDAAQKLRCNERTILRYIGKGFLTAYKLGNGYRIRPQDLQDFIISRKVGTIGQQSGSEGKCPIT
ncbi:MAG: helix-turn-helix domain-containing protein [Endomicrobia bacterium]|nr:helix-turn-helix domain-containing protein [Endomicrobiia bacterium]